MYPSSVQTQAAPFQPVELDAQLTERGRVWVVRDDRLAGGTKERAAIPYLRDLRAQGRRRFVYASPFCGFAQIALAAACERLELVCEIVAEADPATGRAHALTSAAERRGARITLVRDLAVATARARELAEQDPHSLEIPLGFDDPLFKAHLHHALEIGWRSIRETLAGDARRLWLPIGSGTLVSVFRKLTPPSLELHCVNVHVLPASDPRIVGVRSLPGVCVYDAPERFIEPAGVVPLVPSNRFYDAKLWRFVREHAEDGDIWWNVAR